MSERVRWWKNGDHPDDGSEPVRVKKKGLDVLDMSEGKVVKRYTGEENEDALCSECSSPWGAHGWIGGPKTGSLVHPGDYVTVVSARTHIVEHPNPTVDNARENEKNTRVFEMKGIPPLTNQDESL